MSAKRMALSKLGTVSTRSDGSASMSRDISSARLRFAALTDQLPAVG
jgi:hypothetical protein